MALHSRKVWAKPLGGGAHAVLLLAAGDGGAAFAVPWSNVSAELGRAAALCVRDLYTKARLRRIPSPHPLCVAAQPCS